MNETRELNNDELEAVSGGMTCSIPLRPENPKIGGVYNAEVVGDRIAEDGPVFRHLLPQEMQNGSAEVIVGRMGAVVGHVSMHQSPQALDRVKVRAVAPMMLRRPRLTFSSGQLQAQTGIFN